ncbi:MAG: hypothetical protein LBU38_00450 [Propionibacteriaceae bacterium]|jgi:PDZ domain-containing protein|nr:hypothetical protein [Propionibacteriaceae bacterium]
MIKNARTLITSGVLFVLLALLVTLLPMPYVIWSPGRTYNFLAEVDSVPVISVESFDVYETNDQVLLAKISTTSPSLPPSLLSVFFAYLSPNQEVLPTASVIDGSEPSLIGNVGTSSPSVRKTNSIVAALREAARSEPGIFVQPLPMVTSVSASGTAAGILQVGDLVIAIDKTYPATALEVVEAIEAHKTPESVLIEFMRDGVLREEAIPTRDSTTDPGTATIGAAFGLGFRYEPEVDVIPEWVELSEGMMLSIAVYDLLTPGDLAGGGVVAGAGTVDAAGGVGRVDGIVERIAAAERDHARAFVIPEANCEDLRGKPNIRLISVRKLDDALKGIQSVFSSQAQEPVKGCE